ncbi:Quinate dehydrogenase-like protein [Elsinoe fawcettii]|nr:Quinate dehydrogenase-like protein [Elsinoe fawcettii]
MASTMTLPPTSSAPTELPARDLLPSRSHLDRYGFLFGNPISHSLSPLFHNTIYADLGLKWEQFFLESASLPDCLQYLHDPAFYGASVTMPHKVNIIPHLDELTDEARACGACNTIFLKEKDGKRVLCGTNTDVIGVRESFLQNVKDAGSVYEGRPGMVVGGGGAARAAVYALWRYLGAKKIYLVNRDAGEVEVLMQWCQKQGYGEGLVHVKTVEEAEKLESVGAIVACVPDLVPKSEEEITARRILEHFLGREHKGAILEMAYHPAPWTNVAQIATDFKWQVILGTEAMIYQGFEQDRYWTGKGLDELPVEKVKKVISEQLQKSIKH